MKIFIVFFSLFLLFAFASAQERFVKPIDEAAQDKSFLAFRVQLVKAAKKRDAKFVLSIVDANIKNGFGGNDGIAEFKKFWKINEAKSEFWDEFLPVVQNGGTFTIEGKTKIFFAPYSFNAFPDDLDAFNHSVIFGSNVNLRSKADKNASIVGSFSYNIVEILDSVKDASDINKTAWYEVKTLGGKQGFVSADFVRSPIDYRAGFEKINGKWKMTIFVAGD